MNTNHHHQDGDDYVGRHRHTLARTVTEVAVPATVNPGHLVPDGGSRGISHTVWLPPAAGIKAGAVNESELPCWAMARIAAQFLPSGGRLGVCHGPGPGRVGLDVSASPWAPEWMNAAELHRDASALTSLDATLVVADPLDYEPVPTADVAVPFFRTLRQVVKPGGIVLVHTHQATTREGMLDPSGSLVKTAEIAGLCYLQHHVIVHTRLLSAPLSARDGAERRPPRHARIQPRHRRVHSDLLVLLA